MNHPARYITLALLLLSAASCRPDAPPPNTQELVELPFLENPPVTPQCDLMPTTRGNRGYLAYDLNSDGALEYLVENYSGVHSTGFALVDRQGRLLTSRHHIGEIGGDRLLILSSRHHGYFDLLCSNCDPGGVHAEKWIFNGKHYVKISSQTYKGRDEANAFIEDIPGQVRAAWYSDLFARPTSWQTRHFPRPSHQ